MAAGAAGNGRSVPAAEAVVLLGYEYEALGGQRLVATPFQLGLPAPRSAAAAVASSDAKPLSSLQLSPGRWVEGVGGEGYWLAGVWARRRAGRRAGGELACRRPNGCGLAGSGRERGGPRWWRPRVHVLHVAECLPVICLWCRQRPKAAKYEFALNGCKRARPRLLAPPHPRAGSNSMHTCCRARRSLPQPHPHV